MKNGDKPAMPLRRVRGAIFDSIGMDEAWIKQTSPLIGFTKREVIHKDILCAMIMASGDLRDEGERNRLINNSHDMTDKLLKKLES